MSKERSYRDEVEENLDGEENNRREQPGQKCKATGRLEQGGITKEREERYDRSHIGLSAALPFNFVKSC